MPSVKAPIYSCHNSFPQEKRTLKSYAASKIVKFLLKPNQRNVPFRSHSPVSKSGSYLPFYIKKNLGGEAESWDLFSNQQMGLEVQKNLVLVM